MPSLDWNLASERLQISHREAAPSTLVEMVLDAPGRAQLAAALTSLESGFELRHGLSPAWTLYWKLRDGESRLLLAHPDENRWVGTLALTSDDRDRVVQALVAGGPLRAGELLTLGWQSNLDVVLR